MHETAMLIFIKVAFVLGCTVAGGLTGLFFAWGTRRVDKITVIGLFAGSAFGSVVLQSQIV
jgi:hypothetical protein